MPTINQLVSRWRGWINRSKSFDCIELDELENHLLEEIDYLTEKDGLTEDEAFTKAVIEMGKRENLDKEFTKVRGISVQKVKRWLIIHSWIIGALIIILLLSQFSKTQIFLFSSVLDKKPIGSILLKQGFYDFENTVTVEDDSYFFDNSLRNLCKFTNYNYLEKPYLAVTGTYFPTFPQTLKNTCFDFDKSNRLYYLSSLDSYYYNEAEIYQEFFDKIKVFCNNQHERTIELPEIENLYIHGLKILKQNVVLYVSGDVNKESETTPYFLYFNLDNQKVVLKKLVLLYPLVSMDRSGDELAVLTNDGSISIYTISENTLVMQKHWNISDYSKKFTTKEKIFITYSTFMNQIVLTEKGKTNRYFYLTSSDLNKMKFISIFDKDLIGIMKTNYNNKERLVVAKKDPFKITNKCDLYLFQ